VENDKTLSRIIATNNFHEEKAFAETIGTISAVVEATLGLPQTYKKLSKQAHRRAQRHLHFSVGHRRFL